MSLTTGKMVSAADQQSTQSMSYTHKNVPLVVQLYPLDIYLSSGRRKSLSRRPSETLPTPGVYLMQQSSTKGWQKPVRSYRTTLSIQEPPIVSQDL